MTLTLAQLRQKFPALDISGESGRWVIVYCSWSNGVEGRGERFDSYYTAHKMCLSSCGASCRGTGNHQLLEISEPIAVPARRNFAVGY
jgi:hypothetical protein